MLYRIRFVIPVGFRFALLETSNGGRCTFSNPGDDGQLDLFVPRIQLGQRHRLLADSIGTRLSHHACSRDISLFDAGYGAHFVLDEAAKRKNVGQVF